MNRMAQYGPTDPLKALNEASIQDTLEYSHADIKKQAVLHFSTHDLPVKVRVLKKALQDNDQEVVHYAASTLNFIEQDLINRLSDLKTDYQYSLNRETLKKSIKLMDQYITSGLIDGDIKQAYLEQYQDMLYALIREEGQQAETECKLAIAEYKRGHYELASHIFDKLISESSILFEPYLYRMKIAYIQRQENTLKIIARQCLASTGIDIPKEYKPNIAFWAETS